MDPLTMAAIMGGSGLIGGIAGMFKKTPKFEAANLETLRRQNPELYAEFMATLRSAKIMEQMADQRQGLTPAQMSAYQDSQSQVNQQMANRGLVGSSAGTQMASDARTRAMDQLMQQALQERMGLMQGANQARGGAANMFAQATGPMNQANQANVNAQMQNDAAMNQFFSGLMQGGASLYGTHQMMNPQAPSMPSQIPTGSMQPFQPNVQFGQSFNPRPYNFGVNY